jgi:peptidoglycan/xylan/chitin deacetylase (PgdA/CDA1 family)
LTKSRTLITSLRRSLRLVLACCLYYSGLIGLYGLLRKKVFRRREACVLGLHRILSEEESARSDSLPSMVLKEKTFGELLKFLSRQFTVLSFEMFLEHAANPHARQGGFCLLTFDDGWKDTYTRALPRLTEFRMPAVVFVTIRYVGGNNAPWVERLAGRWRDPERRAQVRTKISRMVTTAAQEASLEEAVEYLKHMAAAQRNQILAELLHEEEGGAAAEAVDQMLKWDQVVALSKEGIEIGAHTVTHPLLTFEDDEMIEGELRISRQILEAKLGKTVSAFAYPNGDWDERIRQLVIRTGYRCAFTTRRGWHRSGEDLYTIRRILLHEGNVTGWGGRFSPAAVSYTIFRAS